MENEDMKTELETEIEITNSYANQKSILEEIKKLMHSTRNLCEHETGKNPICCFVYCYGIHKIRESGFKIFNENFPLDDYDFYFFDPLSEASRVCHSECSLSRTNFKMAEKYVENLLKSLY